MSYILFDVGANWGSDSISKTDHDASVTTWAFEPTPELITQDGNVLITQDGKVITLGI